MHYTHLLFHLGPADDAIADERNRLARDLGTTERCTEVDGKRWFNHRPIPRENDELTRLASVADPALIVHPDLSELPLHKQSDYAHLNAVLCYERTHDLYVYSFVVASPSALSAQTFLNIFEPMRRALYATYDRSTSLDVLDQYTLSAHVTPQP